MSADPPKDQQWRDCHAMTQVEADRGAPESASTSLVRCTIALRMRCSRAALGRSLTPPTSVPLARPQLRRLAGSAPDASFPRPLPPQLAIYCALPPPACMRPAASSIIVGSRRPVPGSRPVIIVAASHASSSPSPAPVQSGSATLVVFRAAHQLRRLHAAPRLSTSLHSSTAHPSGHYVTRRTRVASPATDTFNRHD